jgi:hypothetical protein
MIVRTAISQPFAARTSYVTLAKLNVTRSAGVLETRSVNKTVWMTSMGSAASHERTLRATLCEIERGVFYATYPGHEAAAGAEELITYQVGTSAADAQRQIERSAQALGFDTIVWTGTVSVPLFASSSGIAPDSRSGIRAVPNGA